MKTAQGIINQEYRDSKNFMTPHVIKVDKMSRNIAYELSSGEGISHNTIYGVSLVELDEATGKTKRLFKDSDCFSTLAEAESYIEDYKQRC